MMWLFFQPWLFLIAFLFLVLKAVVVDSNSAAQRQQDERWRSHLSKLKLRSLVPGQNKNLNDNQLDPSNQPGIRKPRYKSFDEWSLSSNWTTHVLDYGGKHPFEQQQRKSQSSSSSSSLSYSSSSSSSSFSFHSTAYQPIRITFIVDLVNNNYYYAQKNNDTASRISYILSTVLPQVEQIWSSYLNVIPVVGSIPLDNTVCDGAVANQLPASLLQHGINNTDLAILVTFADTLPTTGGDVVDVCGSSLTFAAARFCAVDQFDRPYLGLVNFCPPSSSNYSTTTSTITSLNTPDEIRLVTHELGHVLGMSSSLFPLFRDPSTGQPRTPRPIINQTVACTGALSGTSQTIPFAAINTIQSHVDDKGLLYYELVTPRVQSVVRNQFDCPTLDGARLESQDTSAACIGSHWDQRWFLGELMGAIFFPNTSIVLSPLTLALMEDTGWYHVTEYGNASLLGFGQGVGCDFIKDDCIANDVVPDYGTGYFCSTPTPILPNGEFSYNDTDFYCDPTHQLWTACDLFDLQQVPSVFIQEFIPKSGIPIHYFSNPNFVSLLPQSNYCPLPRLSLDVVCTDVNTQVVTTYQNEEYGSTSRCVNAYFFDTSLGKQRNFPGCFQVQCDSVAFQVIVNGQACSYDFEEIPIQTINFGTATLICPRLAAVCPNLFCPGDCSGRGTCNYALQPPACECLDASDTSSSCNATTSISSASPVTSPPDTRLPTTSISPPSGKPSTLLKITNSSKTSASSRMRVMPTTSWTGLAWIGMVAMWNMEGLLLCG